MTQAAVSELLTFLLEPRLFVIFLSILVAVLLPFLHHVIFYRPHAQSEKPYFLVLGASGSGKSCLISMVRAISSKLGCFLTFRKLGIGKSRPTYTTQAPACTSMVVTEDQDPATYRSANDLSGVPTRQCMLIDTPGHGKLRHYALDRLANPESIHGVIYCVDASNLSTEGGGIQEAASYLYTVLLELQKHYGKAHKPGARRLPLLIAANKMDLFTALPLTKVQSDLETELTRLRASVSRGLLDSAVRETTDSASEHGWLGDGGSTDFDFSQLHELNIATSVIGGSASGESGHTVSQWRDWVKHNIYNDLNRFW